MSHRSVCLRLAALSLSGLALAACDPDCSAPGRIDGDWLMAARSADDSWRVSGFTSDDDVEEQIAQAELLAQVIANGEREWTIKYVPGNDAYNLTIGGQRYVATATPSKDNCNDLALSVDGTWEGAQGSVHDFVLRADLVWSGDRLAGPFTYEDAWTWGERSGEIRMPGGELIGAPGEPDEG